MHKLPLLWENIKVPAEQTDEIQASQVFAQICWLGYQTEFVVGKVSSFICVSNTIPCGHTTREV